MNPPNTNVESFIEAPPRKRPRSILLGCFGLLVAAPAALFFVLAVVDLATGAENMAGAAVAGACLFIIGALGAAAAFFGFSKKTVPQSASVEDAKALREAFLSVADTSHPVAQKINDAAGLLLDRRYEDAIVAYTAIAEAHPDHRDTAYSQIGAACYFLGRYQDALDWYEKALAHGADASTMRDNIEEAREALAGGR